MSRTCVFHLSANQYPRLEVRHHTRDIWQELAKGFDEYHVLARATDNRFSHTVQGNIHLHLVPRLARGGWTFFFTSWLLFVYVRRWRPTHLVAQCPVMGGLAAAAVSAIFRIPLFVEIHGAHYFREFAIGMKGSLATLFYKAFSSFVFRRASRIRSLSPDMTDRLLTEYGCGLASKTVTIPTRVDLRKFHRIKTSYDVTGALNIITVGALTPTKNHLQLIRDLAVSGIAFRLTIVGAGALLGDCRRLIEDLHLEGQVVLAGKLGHEQLAELLPGQDLYIHYSVSEGLSRAILEAMAVGLPVISTAVGFIRGVLLDEENALVIEKPWASTLPVALGKIQASAGVRQRLGEAARATVLASYEAGAVFDSYRKMIFTSSTP